MPHSRHVWTGLDATISIYQNEIAAGPSGGGSSGDLIMSYCFWEDFTISGTLTQKRRLVTARARPKIVNHMWEYTAKVGCMYFRKIDEIALVSIFSRQQALRVEILLDDPIYSGEFPLENDPHVLKTAYGNSFAITGREDDIITASASFTAEEFDGDIT